MVFERTSLCAESQTTLPIITPSPQPVASIALPPRARPARIIESSFPTTLDELDRLLTRHPRSHWIITLSYELTHTLEPSTAPATPHPSDFPPITAQRLDPNPTPLAPNSDFHALPVTPTPRARIQYTNAVTRALELIRAGDIYQVNLAHHLDTPFSGCAQTLAHRAHQRAQPEFGSFTTFDHHDSRHAVISLSPERFLSYDPDSNTLTTQPMKGTRPSGADPNELRDNPKDRAELNMITDLMRNDLARISVPSSVKVTRPRTITPHASGVLQATSTITSTPREHTSLTDILRATFPPGSVTGAPKVRAAQIINQLESTPRAPYCGTTLHLQPSGAFHASVNIRTIHIQGTPDPHSPTAFTNATLRYHTGAGIVADSDPHAEWEETLTKSSILNKVLTPQPQPS